MSDILAGTPRSYAEPGSNTSKTPASKNRSCPFCHASFTSSSLGRHLDLYIKEKNPKPPDDVHDVEEIRRLRGGVTRRQPRTSSVKGEDSTHSSSKPTSMREQRSPSAPVFFNGTGHANGASGKSSLDRAKWEAAGLVNDLPPRLDSGEPLPLLARRRSNMRNASLKEDLVRKQEALEERDRGQAAELALKEVLESVKAANLRAHPRNLFDFNWFNQSFPAICLRCLSAPVSFVSTPRFPGRPSWPVEPPGADQLRHLELWLKSRVDSWKKRRRPQGGDSHHKTNGTNGHAIQPQPTQQEADAEKEYMDHLQSAYQVWKSLSDEQKQETWRSECQRAFAREQEAHSSTTARLDMVEQQLRHLRAQLDQGRNYQQPIELSQFPVSIMPLSHEALDELNSDVVSNWDHESAILKWKTRIRNERNIQQPLPSAPISKPLWSQTSLTKPLTNGAAPSMQPHGNDQHVHRNDRAEMEHETPDEVDNDEDLVDAPGDDDDEGSVHCHSMPDRMVDGQALDPDLVNHIDTVMKGTNSGTREASGEGYSGGPLLPGLPVDYMKM